MDRTLSLFHQRTGVIVRGVLRHVLLNLYFSSSVRMWTNLLTMLLSLSYVSDSHFFFYIGIITYLIVYKNISESGCSIQEAQVSLWPIPADVPVEAWACTSYPWAPEQQPHTWDHPEPWNHGEPSNRHASYLSRWRHYSTEVYLWNYFY